MSGVICYDPHSLGGGALRMRLFTGVCGLVVGLLCVVSAVGQAESPKGVEIFGGFTRSRSDLACCAGNANGFHLGLGYRPIRFLLLESEFSHAFGSDPQYVRHLHFGPQVMIPVGSLRPFGRIMAGFSEHQTECPDVPGVVNTRDFSLAFGGGVDLMVHPRFGIRAISFDRIWTKDQWDTRASFGVVFLIF